MKKAVIATGAKQYLVAVGDQLAVELLPDSGKQVSFQPLLVIDGDKVAVGRPLVDEAVVKAKVVEAVIKEDKVTSIRFKAKKRVHKRRGHRQRKTVLEITEIV